MRKNHHRSHGAAHEERNHGRKFFGSDHCAPVAVRSLNGFRRRRPAFGHKTRRAAHGEKSARDDRHCKDDAQAFHRRFNAELGNKPGGSWRQNHGTRTVNGRRETTRESASVRKELHRVVDGAAVDKAETKPEAKTVSKNDFERRRGGAAEIKTRPHQKTARGDHEFRPESVVHGPARNHGDGTDGIGKPERERKVGACHFVGTDRGQTIGQRCAENGPGLERPGKEVDDATNDQKMPALSC